MIVGAIFDVLQDPLQGSQEQKVIFSILILHNLNSEPGCEFVQVIDTKIRPGIGLASLDELGKSKLTYRVFAFARDTIDIFSQSLIIANRQCLEQCYPASYEQASSQPSARTEPTDAALSGCPTVTQSCSPESPHR